MEALDRQTGIDTVKRLLDLGDIKLADVQREVWKYGVEKMQDLSHDAFRECVATLTKS